MAVIVRLHCGVVTVFMLRGAEVQIVMAVIGGRVAVLVGVAVFVRMAVTVLVGMHQIAMPVFVAMHMGMRMRMNVLVRMGVRRRMVVIVPIAGHGFAREVVR